MKKTEEFLNRWKLKLMAVGVLIALSLVVVLAGFRFYSRYREQVIRTEESQLLTMAGIVGNNLDSYLEQQLDGMVTRNGKEESKQNQDKQQFALIPYVLSYTQDGGLLTSITISAPE